MIREHEEAILRAIVQTDADPLWEGAALALDSDPLDWPIEERPVIYVAGYYSACPTQGTANAIRAFDDLLNVGWVPLVPHASLVIDMLSPHPPQFWYSYDLALLKRCDAMYVCPDTLTAHSTGVLKEIDYAHRHNIPVFYDVVEAKDRYDD